MNTSVNENTLTDTIMKHEKKIEALENQLNELRKALDYDTISDYVVTRTTEAWEIGSIR